MITILGQYTIEPGGMDIVVAAAQGLAAATRTEAGCLSYLLYRSVEHPVGFCSVETWADLPSLEAHRAAFHVRRYVETVGPVIASRSIAVIDSTHGLP